MVALIHVIFGMQLVCDMSELVCKFHHQYCALT
jgi:hypothetical protein